MLASTVPDTQALVDTGNPLQRVPLSVSAKVDQLPRKMSTQESLPQDTQPVSQSIYESILGKAKNVGQLAQGPDNHESVEVEQDSLQEGDEGHIDLLSSYKLQEQELDGHSDSEPVDFSPTQTQHHLSQFPESQRFKTPGTTSRKRDYNGDVVETPSLPRNPLARNGAPVSGKVMGLSQAFAATQAVSSPFVNLLPSGPLSDRPSPNIELHTRPDTTTLSSPLRTRSDLRRTATEPYSHYKSIKQSQAERERLSLFEQQERDALGDNLSDDDFDDESSLVERNRRRKEREQKIREQFQAVSSPNRPSSRWSVGAISSPAGRLQPSSPKISARPHGRRTGQHQDHLLISSVLEKPDNGVTGFLHDSEEETEQEDEIEVARSSQIVIPSEEDKENLGFTGVEVPETVARLRSPINGCHGVDSSPSVRQSAGPAPKEDGAQELNAVELFAVANSQPSHATQQHAYPQHTRLDSSGDGPSFVPQSQILSNGNRMSSPPSLLHPATTVASAGVAGENPEAEIVIERTSSREKSLALTESGQPDPEAGSGDEVNTEPTSTVRSPKRIFNEASAAETTSLVVQGPHFPSRHSPMALTTVAESSSSGGRESDPAPSGPRIDSSKAASSSSGQIPRTSAEFETARTHLSTTTEAVLPSLPRQPSYVSESPSGRKRRRMTEIAADPSPRKSGSDFDMDVAMATVVDKDFQGIIGSSSPIAPGRRIKRRRLQERQPNALVEEAMPEVTKESESVWPNPDRSRAMASVDVLPLGNTDVNANDPSQNSPQAVRPSLRSSNASGQLAVPAHKVSVGRVSTRSLRTTCSTFDVPVSPKQSEAPKPRRSATKSDGPPSTMPASKVRVSVALPAPCSATQVGRWNRGGSRESVLTPNQSLHPPVLDASKISNPGSDVPLGDVVAPNQILACFNGKTRAYYPATCLGTTGSDSLRYYIQWEGFEVDEADARGVRRLDLRVGDAVKVNLDGFPKVSHIVRGFKDKVLPSGKGGPMTDIRGYSVLIVAPKQRKGFPGDLSAESLQEVPISAIYLDSNMWSQMKEREYKYVPSQSASLVDFATPSERPSTPATPSSRSKRNLTLSTNTVLPDTVGIFAGMAFAISYDEARKLSLTHLIRTHGGTVLFDGFHELFAGGSMMLKPSCANLGFIALLADRHSRKEKYMQALALSLPCLSGRWIESCVAKECVIDWQPYLLPAGESAVLDGAIRSRILPAIPEPSMAKINEIIEMRPRLLSDSTVIFVTGRGKVEEKRKPFVFLTQAMGAGRIEKVIDLKAAKALLDGDDSQSKRYKWVFVDDTQVVLAKTMLEAEQGDMGDRLRVVGNEFICQSLILGGLVED